MRKTLCLGTALLVLGWGHVGQAHSPVQNPTLSPSISVETNPAESSDLPESVVPEPVSPAPSTQEPPKIELINRGEKPRKKLRFKAQVGEKLRSRMIMSSETLITINDEPFPNIPIPDVEVVTESEVVEVQRDGTTRVQFRYLVPAVKTAADDPFSSIFESVFKEQFKALTDATVTYVFDKRGRLLESDIETDIDPNDPSLNLLKQLMQSSQQSSGIFPKKKVGVGAQWSAPQSVTLQGNPLTQDVTYSLLEIQDEQVKIGTEVMIDSPEFMEQMTSVLPMMKDVPLTVETFEVSLQGDMTMSLSQYMATNMDLKTDGNVVVTLPVQDKDMKISVTITSIVKMIPDEVTEAE